MNKIIKDAFILFAITLVAGIVLGAVYNITKGPIAEQNEKTKQAAYKEVLADADSFEAIDNEKYSEENLASLVSSLKDTEEDFSADEVTDVVAGVKDGKIVGFVVTIVAGDGYSGDIQFSVGISSEGKYTGTSILSISETAGLGMRAKTDPSFLSQFVGVNVDKFTVVKDGSGSSSDDKIDAISGSTVTSKAVTKGINAALAVYRDLISENVKTVGGASVE
jgi:electron transport complex protein RnfG